MPFKNFHSARVSEPNTAGKYGYKKNFFFNKSKNEEDKGIDVIFSISKKEGPRGGKTKIQSIRFSSSDWTPKTAKSWLKKHGVDYIMFEPASEKMNEEAIINTASVGDAYYGKRMSGTLTRNSFSKFLNKKD